MSSDSFNKASDCFQYQI